MPPIDLHGHDLRRRRHAHRQGALPLLGHLVVALPGQFGAELGSDALHVTGTDRHPRKPQRQAAAECSRAAASAICCRTVGL